MPRVAYLNIIAGNDRVWSGRLLLQGGRRSPANRCRHVPPRILAVLIRVGGLAGGIPSSC